ncbi:MAG: hypothetical protein ACOQNY_02765 [Mycoplasmoidaceae bacterium]
MGKRLRIVNIAIPVIATASLAIVPLAMWGSDMAYYVNHFRAIYNSDAITLSNPNLVLHQTYHTFIQAANPEEEISDLFIYVGSKQLDPEYDYLYDSEKSELTIYGEQITDRSLIIVSNNVAKGHFEFRKDLSTTQIHSDQDLIQFVFEFKDGDIPPLDMVTASLTSQVTKSDGQIGIVKLTLEDDLGYFDGQYVNYFFTFEWENPKPEPITQAETEQMELVLSYTSGVTGIEEDAHFTDGLTAELITE